MSMSVQLSWYVVEPKREAERNGKSGAARDSRLGHIMKVQAVQARLGLAEKIFVKQATVF